MAQIKRKIVGDFETVKKQIDDGLRTGSMTITTEEEFSGDLGGRKYWVVSYERYAASSKSRVSMNITMLEGDDTNLIMGTSTGGSQAVLFKMNKFPEVLFLQTLERVLDDIERRSR